MSEESASAIIRRLERNDWLNRVEELELRIKAVEDVIAALRREFPQEDINPPTLPRQTWI